MSAQAPFLRETANVLGLGLIGGSIALALRRAGWTVHGEDAVPGRSDEALARGVIEGEKNLNASPRERKKPRLKDGERRPRDPTTTT